jgi:hypothetical protein
VQREGETVRRTHAFVYAIAAITGITAASVLASTASAESTGTLTDTTVTNPDLPDGVASLGQGRIAEDGGRSYVLYAARFTNEPWVLVRDESSGETSHIALPAGTTGGTAWARADLAVAGGDMWILSGAGPVYLRHYRLSGSPLPTTATVVAEHLLGNSDSRAGALTALASGNVAGVWHQQAATTPHGLNFVHATPGGVVRTAGPVSIATRSSTQAIAQHPADQSLWVFSSADAGSAIAAVHLSEQSTGLRVDWVNSSYISEARHGTLGPDPEAPDVEAAVDTLNGAIAVAYQSAERRVFSTQPWIVGSQVAVARVRADASISFLALPDYVERISAIGLVVRENETWLAYRPIADDLTFDTLHVRRHDGSAWGEPVVLGKLGDPRAMVYFGRSVVNFGGPMADNLVHLFVAGPVAAGATLTSDTTTTTSGRGETTVTSSKGKGGGRKK